MVPREFLSLTRGGAATRIHGAEHRGILPNQLQSLADFLTDKCDSNGIIAGWLDAAGNDIPLGSVNLYSVTNYVIKPLTEHQRCSYVEAICIDPALQEPLWFVSHWWGEAVLDFIACVLSHQKLRGISSEAAYWVCAYANNQHELGADLGVDPMQSSFLKAMQVSIGVLLILDENATPFTRIWCCFEEGVVMLASRGLLPRAETSEALIKLLKRGSRKEPPKLLFDIATCVGPKVHLITDGLTPAETASEEQHKRNPHLQSGWYYKRQREAEFPMRQISKALHLDLTQGQASLAKDKQYILNALAGKPLNSPPDLDLEVYKEANRCLRSAFALASWTKSGEEPLIKAAVEEDVSRKVLEFNVTVNHSEGVALLGFGEVCQTLAKLRNLVVLKVDLSARIDVISLLELGSALSNMPRMRSLTIDARFCFQLNKKSTFGSFLEIFGCGSKQNALDPIGSAIEHMPGLQNLSLDFSNCFQLGEHLDSFGRGLGALTSLKTISLNLKSTTAKHLQGLAEGLQRQNGLVALSLNFKDCSRMEDVRPLSKILMSFVHLKRLDIQFPGPTQVVGYVDLTGAINHVCRIRGIKRHQEHSDSDSDD